MGKAQPGEDAILGEFGWGRRAQREVEQPNRELMIEFCTSVGMQIANTFYQQTLQDKVTLMEAGALPMGEISEDKYTIPGTLRSCGASTDHVITKPPGSGAGY
eukprot:4851438-Pyramimonas_sp.AAC.1